RLVDDVNLAAAQRGRQVHLLAQVSNLVDAAVGGRVDLDQVERRTRGHLDAGVALATSLGRALGPVQAVDRLGQQPRGAGLAGAPRAAEEVGVGDPPGGDGALQGARDRLLPHEVGEGLRTVLAVEGLVGAHVPIGRAEVTAHPLVDSGTPGVAAGRSSGPDGCGTLRFPPYRCFLPDLTGFGDPSCAGPGLQRCSSRTDPKGRTSEGEFDPAKADCRCRVPPVPRLARPARFYPPDAASTPRRAARLAQARLANTSKVLTGITTAAATTTSEASWPWPRKSATQPKRTAIKLVESCPKRVWVSAGRRPASTSTPPTRAGSR